MPEQVAQAYTLHSDVTACDITSLIFDAECIIITVLQKSSFPSDTQSNGIDNTVFPSHLRTDTACWE
jgi:hypothetical protein